VECKLTDISETSVFGIVISIRGCNDVELENQSLNPENIGPKALNESDFTV
jgi:hypothetical protein